MMNEHVVRYLEKTSKVMNHYLWGFFRFVERPDSENEKYPESDSAQEEIFQSEVSKYKNINDPRHLKTAYEKLTNEYPKSLWTKRAYPYRLIQ